MFRVRGRGTLLVILSAGLLILGQPASSQSPELQPSRRAQLRVVLYPFIPEFTYAAETVKRLFEAENPNIDLKVLDLSDNYYAPPEPGKVDPTYIGDVQTDVYELDSVFLADFVQAKKIQPLQDDILLPQNELLKNAYAGSMLNGVRYGSAHWVCGDFLFYSRDHVPSGNISTLKDLEGFVGSDPTFKLLVDLKGRLTLGEFYLGAAYAKYKDWSEVKNHIDPPDTSLESDLIRVLKMCPAGRCRDQIFHELTGIYGQEFALKRSKALIGYSELLHSVLKEGFPDGDLNVTALPLDDAGAVPISWVDSFAVGTGCLGDCYQRAAKFIKFMQRDDIYLKLVLPDRPSFLSNPAGPSPIPAYLLPAKASLYSDPTLTSKAHLYPALKKIIEGASVPTAVGLNQELRTVSSSVDKALSSSDPK